MDLYQNKAYVFFPLPESLAACESSSVIPANLGGICGSIVAVLWRSLEILQLRRHHTKLDIGLQVIQLSKSRQFGHNVLDGSPTYGFTVKG